MKLVRILVHPFDLGTLVDALQQEGFVGATIDEVLWATPETTQRRLPGRPWAEVSIAMHDDLVDRVFRCVQGSACRRERLVTIEALEQAVRIRTGEIDEAAL